MKNYVSLVLMSAALVACTNSYEMTYSSDPVGATIYEEGAGKLGNGPVAIRYAQADKHIDNNVFYTGRMTAVWVSGATATIDHVAVPLPENGNKIAYTFIRPDEVVGAEKDQKFAYDFSHTLRLPQDRYASSLGQDKDGFDYLDRQVTCAWYTLIDAVYANCP